MSITIGNINPVNPSGGGGFTTADNGLNASTPTNVELGGAVTKTTQLVLSNNSFFINGGSGTGSASFSVTGGNDVFIFAISNAFNEYYFHVTTTSGEFGLNAAGTKSVLQALVSGLFVLDNNFNIGIVNAADYSANIVGNPNALTSVAAVQLLINAVFNPALYARVSGQVFTGNISAPNLSGTNTGDQNLTPYALLAGASFTGQVNGLNNPSGTAITTAFLLRNLNAAAPGAQQVSAALEFDGNGWGTTAGTSQLVQAFLYLLPVQGTVPTGEFHIAMKIAGGATVQPFILNSNGALTVTGTINGPAISVTGNIAGGQTSLTAAKTSVPGSTSGTALFNQPAIGAGYKKVVIFLTALIGTASYTFPTAFINTPQIMTTNGPAAGIVTSLSNTAVTVTGATTSGFIFLEGY